MAINTRRNTWEATCFYFYWTLLYDCNHEIYACCISFLSVPGSSKRSKSSACLHKIDIRVQSKTIDRLVCLSSQYLCTKRWLWPTRIPVECFGGAQCVERSAQIVRKLSSDGCSVLRPCHCSFYKAQIFGNGARTRGREIFASAHQWRENQRHGNLRLQGGQQPRQGRDVHQAHCARCVDLASSLH